MTLQMKTFVLGPIQNNTYLFYEDHAALVIDPAMEPEPLAEFIRANDLILEKVLITHGHFDHYYGLTYLQKSFPALQDVYMHAEDLDLWRSGGSGRQFFGKDLSIPVPNQLLLPHTSLIWRGHELAVRHVPGHTPGSVLFYSAELACAFCGDAIFFHGIGRTDLPGSDYGTLLHSIQTQIFTLPDSTRLLPGHGPETTVAEEKANNPFLRQHPLK
jgi:glyoxylase-like metal-dependent hydrolase (beta-lactamase superfamily II)